MSTEYGFVDKRKKESLLHYGRFLNEQKEALTKALEKYKEQNPGVQAEVDDSLLNMMSCNLFKHPEVMRDKHIIAVSTSTCWYWRHDNCFGSLEDVRKFLDTHPDYVIENEYGVVIPYSELEEIIKTVSEK